MPSTARKPLSERLNVRVSREQSRLIRLAAKQTQSNVSKFVVESACQRAEEALASQNHLVYDEKQWGAFMEALDRPPIYKPRLQALLKAEPGSLLKKKK